MVLGDPQEWVQQFVSLDERFLERVVAVWPACLAVLPPQPGEDAITRTLVDRLCKDETVRSICHWVEYQYEPFTNSGITSTGKIDMAVLLNWERDRYLAYECKRLNVVNAGIRSSLAGRYVTDGMMRFMTDQYARGIPVGCMLGYVLDGDVPFAMKQLASAIKMHLELGLIAGPTSMAPTTSVQRFITNHVRPLGTSIELRHALIAFPRALS